MAKGLNAQTSNNQAPIADVNAFFKFQQQIIALDDQLRELSNHARRLGSSVGILSAATRLRERLGPVEYLFRQNAQDLFPNQIEQRKHDVLIYRRLNRAARHSHRRGDLLDRLARPHTVNLDPKQLASEFKLFARDISTLLRCFSQYPEFVDEVPDESLGDELTDWAEALDEYEDDFKNLATQTYLHDSMAEIGERLDKISKRFIPVFIDIGIPTISSSQKHSAKGFDDLATVATFFSGVTATMFQFSYTVNTGRLAKAVNAFWFISFVFSISSAINSLLALTWTQAIFRSPDYRVPWWVRIWVKRSPLVFLVLSVTCFIVGLVLFTHSSNQATVTIILTTVLSAVCCFGIAAMSGWFAGEFWIYERYDGKLWLADVIYIVKEGAKKLTFVALDSVHPYEVWHHGKTYIMPSDGVTDPEVQRTRIGLGRKNSDDVGKSTKVSFWLTHDKQTMTTQEICRYRWGEAIRRVLEEVRKHKAPPPYSEKPEAAVTINTMLADRRASDSKPKLRAMAITHEFPANGVHDTLVRLMQFSPDGTKLVTSSLDRKCSILDLDTMLVQQSLPYPPGPAIAHQLEWSPDGSKLLMRRNRVVTIWNSDGKSFVNVERPHTEHPIRCIAWYHDSHGYLSVEPEKLNETNVNGRELRSHDVQNLNIRAAAITSDSKWMVCVGKYHGNDDKSKKLGRMHHILVYSLETNRIVKKAPVFYEMSDITLAWNNRSALVSYENKAPPQLWDFYTSTRGRRDVVLGLVLRHTYMPEEATAFAGLPSIFGGSHDQLVLRAAAAGDIYAWDRDSAALLHRIRMPAASKDIKLTAFTWNRASANNWMFATGTSEGAVHILSIPEKPASKAPSRSATSDSPAPPTWDQDRVAAATQPSPDDEQRSSDDQGLMDQAETWGDWRTLGDLQ